MLQPNVPIPVLVVCFLCGSSKMNFSLMLLVAGMFPAQKGTVPQGLGSLHHTPKGNGAQVLTTITAKGVLPLQVSTEGFEMYVNGQKAQLVELI